MGQFGNQPDFITNDIQTVTPVLAANLAATDSLDGSIIYVGTSAPGNLQVIPVGAVGPSVVTGFSSLGFSGSGGTGYVQGTEYDLLGGNGTALAAEFNVVNGAIVSVINITSGAIGGYLNGDLVTVDGGDGNATLRIVAAPGPPTAAQAITFTNVIQGEWFPVVVDYVLSDLTTVTNLIAGK